MRSQHKYIHVQNFLLRGQKEVTKKKATQMSCPTDTLNILLFQWHAHTDSSALSPESLYLLRPCSRVLMRFRNVHVAQPLK